MARLQCGILKYPTQAPYILDWEVNLATKTDWAAFDIESGTLQVNEAKVLKLTLDATQLAQGQYTTDFLFTTADGLIEKKHSRFH